jgi:predicted N-acetyltransferase YhbS
MVIVNGHSPQESAGLVIRPIEPRDAAEVCALIQQLGYERPLSEVAGWIQSLPDNAQSQTAFVADLAGEVIGWIEISIQHRLQSAPYALIGGLVVKEGFRNQKLGLRLCEESEKWGWQHGASVIRVTSRSTRADAHRFYLSNGYSLSKISQVFEKKRPA